MIFINYIFTSRTIAELEGMIVIQDASKIFIHKIQEN